MNALHQRETPGRFLWAAGRGRARQWRQLAAWSIVEAVPAYLSGRLVAQAVDDGFLAGRPATGFGFLALLAAAVLVGAWATRQTCLRLAALVEPLRDELVRRAVTGSLRRATAGCARPDTSAVARLTQQTEIVREAYAGVLTTLQGFVVVTTAAGLGLLSLDPVFLALVLPPMLLGLVLFLASLPRLAARQRDAILAEEQIAAAAGVLGQGMVDTFVSGGEDLVRRAVSRPIEAHADATRELARLTALRTTTVAIGGWVPILLILLAGPWLLRRGVTTGTILGALAYVSFGLHPALEALVRGVSGPGLWLVITLRRLLDATGSADGAHRPPGGSDAQRGRQDLQLRDVCFAYGPASTQVIDHLDLTVREGEHLAIVGPSGAGKSTLAGLAAGMLEPQHGEIRLGGVRLSDLDARTRARTRVLIPQEAYVFAGTLRENLTYLREDAVTSGELDRVTEELGLGGLLDDLGGYDAELVPHRLSAGGRQLVSLARAYLSPAPLVVLDEATCHLDATAEARVELAFARRPGSLIVIAHRISSARRAQRVLVLDGADAVVGEHDELVSRSVLYGTMAGLWESPAGP